MNIKKLIMWLTPPLLLEIYKSYKQGFRGGYIWEGVYQHYRDVPISGDGYNSERIVKDTFARTQRLLTSFKQYGTVPLDMTDEHNLLPLLASVVCSKSGHVIILDLGGGMGADYIRLTSSLECCSIDYHIVETSKMCEGGELLFRGDDRVHFHSSLPSALPVIDIVYLSSVLQYIEDYAGLLKSLCAYRPRYFLFVKLSAGDIPTYATVQKNLPDAKLPYWFLNLREVIRIMLAGGYSLIFKGALEREYDQDNFPTVYRLGRACNLLFVRTDLKTQDGE
jgi:putative methyltransferase (TIGR04325 family)